MYHLYNLIEPHDRVRAPAIRRVQSESSTGSIESHRVRVTLTIDVSKTTFDATGSTAPLDPAQATDGASTPAQDPIAGALGGGGGGEGATLQVSGKVVSENKHVKMGVFHTLNTTSTPDLSLHYVRSVAPNKDMYCLSFRLTKKILLGS